MTANASLVSNRSTPPTSAVQARANSQSAAIALLGAGTSSLNQGEGSFADSLQSESKRQAPAQGLFSDSADTTRPGARADRSAAPAPRRDEARDPKPSPEETDQTSPLSPRTGAEKSKSAQFDEPATDSPLSINDIRTARDPNPVPATGPAAQITHTSVQNPQAQAAASANEPSPEQANSNASNAKSPRASDPLRLIVPQQQQQTQAESAPIDPQNAAQSTAQTASIAHNATKPISVRKNESASGTSGSGHAAPVNSTMPAGTGIAIHTGAPGTAATAQSSNGVTGITGASASGGVSSPGAPLDQVAPPRVPGGRPIEQPVTLKLKMGPATSSTTPPLSEAEITAAETQIGRGLTAAFRQNTPQVTLWMSPETLGKVRIDLTFDQGTISARFETTSESTRELLANNLGALREALQSRGLTANQIEVVSIPDWSQQNNSQSGSGQGSSTNQQTPDQSSSGGNTPSGHGGHPQQGQPEHSKGWAALPQGDAPSKPSSITDAQVSLVIDSRMMSLQAHLELDAVA
ncbi:MAG: flagellar hook-length control protein FliK [Phycisphaerales bacterium]|nr:flagellar hook-length control protein FliK [Phycisphaerales bacterium]